MTDFVYTLSDDEVERLERLSVARGKALRRKGVKNQKIARTEADLNIERMGTWGEYAACMLLGAPFSDTVGQPDDGTDTTICGRTVQVRATRWGNRMLTYTKPEAFTTDLAVLMLVYEQERRVVAAGWIGKRDFHSYLDGHGLVDLRAGFGPQPAIPVSALRPMDTLLPLVEGACAGCEKHQKTEASPFRAEQTPAEIAANVAAAYVPLPDGGARCAGCRSATPSPTTLLDFAAWMHYTGCTVITPVDQISQRVQAVEAAMLEGVYG